MESPKGSNVLTTRIQPTVIAVLLSMFGAVGFSVGCAVNPKTSEASQKLGKPKETPVPLVSSEANGGKRCAPRVYSDVGQDDDYNPFCYELQRRLVKATHEGNLAEMRIALRDGANADGSAYDLYYPPLRTAAEDGKGDAVRLLLDNGSNVNQGDFINGTPLMAAARNGHPDVVRLLIERGADVCLKADGGTAKEFAQAEGHNEIADILRVAETAKCK